MEWSAILEALGGGPGAMMIVGLVWFARYQIGIAKEERGKADSLTDLLMERKDEEIRDAQRREIAVQQSLEAVMRVIESRVRDQ